MPSKIKILLISTNADEAGAPRHVEAIVNGLKTEFQFNLVFGEDGPVSVRLRQQGHIVHIIREMRTAISPIKDFVALMKIRKIALEVRPDIIHCHSAKAGMLGRICALLCGSKWLYTVHGWGWRGVSTLAKILIVLIEFILSRLPRGFYIFVAHDVRNAALNVLRIKFNKGVVIYNGVSSIDVNFPQDRSSLVILMPARVSSAKDHQSLISAFEYINDPKMKLLLCGTGTDEKEFIEFAKELAPTTNGSISFLGQRSDMHNIYSQSHIVALISNFEALPLSIIEAMSCSRAVIGTNVGGIPELITSNANGILVRPNCVSDIVDALNILKDEQIRARLGNQAKITYNERFTENAMLTSVAHTYKNLGGSFK